MRHLAGGLILVGLAAGATVAAQESTGTVPAAVDPAPRPVRLAGGVIAGRAVKKVAPTYPESAKQKHIMGTVLLHAIINKEGAIESLSVISGPEELRKSSLKAVSQWRYKPYLLNGAATEVDTTITVNYFMAGYGPPAMPPPEEQEPPPAPEAPAVLPDFSKIPATPGVLRVSGGTMAAMLEMKVAPVYPDTDAAGTVVLIATIAKSGEVEKLDAFSGPSPLRAAALEAVRQWRYKPYLVDGVPIEVQTTVLVRFAR